MNLEREFILRKLTVGLEVAAKEGITPEQLPEFLTQDIWNNGEMVERVTLSPQERMARAFTSGRRKPAS